MSDIFLFQDILRLTEPVDIIKGTFTPAYLKNLSKETPLPCDIEDLQPILRSKVYNVENETLRHDFHLANQQMKLSDQDMALMMLAYLTMHYRRQG